jgi:hypothetical protein
MVVMPILSVLLAIVLYLGSRTMTQDVARRDARMQDRRNAVSVIKS